MNTMKVAIKKATNKTTATTTAKRFLYSQNDNAVTCDLRLPKTALHMYITLERMSDKDTHEVTAYVDTLAKQIGRSIKTARRHLATLEKFGIIGRKFNKSHHNSKMNLATTYIVYGRHAECYRGTKYGDLEYDILPEYVSPDTSPANHDDYNAENPFLSVPPAIFGDTKDSRTSLSKKEYIKDTLKREASLPKSLSNTNQSPEPEIAPATPEAPAISETPVHTVAPTTSSAPDIACVPEKPKAPNRVKAFDFAGVPDIMRTTAEYLLRKTGRETLTAKELEALRWLSENHMPTRIQKEIDTAVARFEREGRPLTSLYFGYIAASLKHQKSYPTKRARKSRNEKAQNPQPVFEATQEYQAANTAQVLPVEEAERVISEYTPAVKECEGIPAALEELHEKIRAKEAQMADEYIESLPQTDEGLPDWDKAEHGEDGFPKMPQISLEDYLRLKYPEADEEELRTDTYYVRHEQNGLQEALEIDRTCANCYSPSNCPLNRKKGRPVVCLETDWRGRKGLQVRYTATCIRCKHEKGKPNPEFESRVKRSGLTERQSKQTFASYNHEGMTPEIISAKAKAMLAAKNRTSLILAGKAGTGKTHLAISIALSAMQEGRKAIFRTMPELLDELRRADWEHRDFNGLLRMFSNVSCLVIDDWGKEKPTPKNMEYLYQIIDYRYRHGLQTIVTTNASDMFGLMNECNADKIEPLVSRILENGEWVTIQDAKNYRLTGKIVAQNEEFMPAPISEPEPQPEVITEALPEPLAVQPSKSGAQWREDMYDRPERPDKRENVDDWTSEDDAKPAGNSECDNIAGIFGSMGMSKEPERTGIYRYFPNYDNLSLYDKQQAIFWWMQNQDKLETDEVASSATDEPSPAN